jgi:hypothetical protein
VTIIFTQTEDISETNAHNFLFEFDLINKNFDHFSEKPEDSQIITNLNKPKAFLKRMKEEIKVNA